MKNLLFYSIFLFSNLIFGQKIISEAMVKKQSVGIVEPKIRKIKISRKQISIPYFAKLNTETLYLDVVKIEDRNLGGDIGVKKVYDCITRDQYKRKAIVYIDSEGYISLNIFTDEVDIFNYLFLTKEEE